MKTVLVVEDEENLLEALRYNLDREGYRVLCASDGLTALELARADPPDLIILDLLLPELDGLEVCRLLRRESSIPILMLTAKGEEVDKVVGLELGADDYLTKPFSMRELLARIRALLRRAEMVPERQGPGEQEVIRVGELEVDRAARRVSVRGSPVSLTPKEFELLAFLVQHRGRVFTRDQLLDQVWGQEFVGDVRTVDVHIRHLRKRIEADPANPQYLITVRGVGYRLEG